MGVDKVETTYAMLEYANNRVAQLEALNAELVEAMGGLTRWVGKGIADDMYADCVNPAKAQVDLTRAEDVIRKARGES